MKTYRSKAEMPASGMGWCFWLQYRDFGVWVTLCALRTNDARQVLGYLDTHPTCTTLRILAEAPGTR